MFIVSFRNRNKEFWGIMGYYFSNKEIRKELPFIIDEKEKVWVIGFKNVEEVVGFLSYKILNGTATITNCFINKKYRKMGYFNKLILYTLNKLKNVNKIKMIILKKYEFFFRRLGFYESYKKGKYIGIVKEEWNANYIISSFGCKTS